MKAIDKSIWEKAQQEEFKLDSVSDFDSGILHFRKVYDHYFHYLGISRNLKEKNILEIGPANFPAISFCHNFFKSYVIEPNETDHLLDCVTGRDIVVIVKPAEEIEHFPRVYEIWLLNILQHTMDPELILKKCMQTAKVIRFFEPINCGTSPTHLHDFTLEYFENIFGQKVNHFAAKQEIVGFHDSECAYGVINLKP